MTAPTTAPIAPSGGRADRPTGRYRLVPGTPQASTPPQLDAFQQRVVDHRGGPLLVLAGPGTGKTTTLVESVVARVAAGVDPTRILVLTFSRRAAADLRRRITARLADAEVAGAYGGRPAGVATPRAMTFHALCHQLVRRFVDPEIAGTGLRLLTAPEQDFRVREVLAGTGVRWPDTLAAAVPTHAFAGEVRALMTRARQLGMDPEDLIAAGRGTGRDEWVGVGEFFAEYLDVTDAEGVLDYAELVHRSRILLTDPAVQAELRREIDWVFVDEYQDTDPAQVDLLHALVPPGGNLVVVGDPDQSIYEFRGAEPRGILDFPERFPTTSGAPAPVCALGRTRRFGPVLAAAARRISARLPLPRVPAEVGAAFRSPDCEPGTPRGRVEVFTCVSAGAEAEHIAELLRSAHLHDGVPWTDMAVLVRSGRRSIPALSRALVAAGVPVEVAGDEIPLSAELAVRPLLLAVQVAADGRRPDPDEATRLLTSPLGGLDSLALRRLGRLLREAERAELAGTGLPRSSDELIAQALADPTLLDDVGQVVPGGTEPAEVRRARDLARLLARAERMIRARASAPVVLWELWSATGWPARLQADSAAGGDAGRRADRDLDAVCALFDVAAQSEEKSGHKGVTAFLADVAGQQIPADTWRESDLRGSGVRLLTAHRAKGLEWPLVVVAGVQEGVWPDLRRHARVLAADELSPAGPAAGPTIGPAAASAAGPVTGSATVAQRIAEERRLFYVACTRATRRLVVTAVEGTEGENDQPSRFLAELGVSPRALPGRPRRPLSLPGLVGELRATSVDPDAPPALREAAAARLARLADAVDDQPDGTGRPLVAAAEPDRWWGMHDPTTTHRPVVAPDAEVRLSGSQLAGLLSCPRSWFLSRKANGDPVRNTAASFGSVVHVLVEHAARAAMAGEEVDAAELTARLDQVWQQLAFDANWLSQVERIEAEAAVDRYLAWHEGRPDREVLGVEVRFDTSVDCRLPDGRAEAVRVTGTIDRVERDRLGRIHVIDFKTGRTAPKAADVAAMDQLGVYQLAVKQGAIADLTGPNPVLGGAELVYLRMADGTYPKVFTQPSLDDAPHLDAEDADGWHPTWVHQRLAAAAELIRSERFEARIGDGCRYCRFRTSCPAQGEGRQVVA